MTLVPQAAATIGDHHHVRQAHGDGDAIDPLDIAALERGDLVGQDQVREDGGEHRDSPFEEVLREDRADRAAPSVDG